MSRIVCLLEPARNPRRLKLHFHQVLKDGTLDRFDRILGAANEAQLPLSEECSLSRIYPVKQHSCFLRSTHGFWKARASKGTHVSKRTTVYPKDCPQIAVAQTSRSHLWTFVTCDADENPEEEVQVGLAVINRTELEIWPYTS
jgi:hypothetical protein